MTEPDDSATMPPPNPKGRASSTDNGNGEERHMNDTTMPPPQAGSLRAQVASMSVSASPSAAASSNNKPSSQQQQQPRQKKGLKKGFGLSDWNRLTQVSKDLAQRKGQPLRRIRMKEIQQHNTVHDGWCVVKGKVYFLSPYLAYHPGGEKILKAVLGKDATALFEKYHTWVNEDPLIGKLLLGYLDTSRAPDDDDSDYDDDGRSGGYLPTGMGNNNAMMPPPPRPKT